MFALAKTTFGGWIIGRMVAYMNFLIPVERLLETPTLLAFYHPKPAYPVHILIVPKKGIRSMIHLTSEDSMLLVEVFQAVRRLVEELKLEKQGYRLIANGGSYQEVPQLHFHLISE